MEQRSVETGQTGTECACGRRGRQCVSGRRLVLGVGVLMVVDVIWVASAVLSEKLFKEETYPKPFFSVYFKTSLFALCLFPFVFWRPWHRLCCPRPIHPPPPSPAPGPLPQSLPKKSCLKRIRTQGMWVGGSAPPPSPPRCTPPHSSLDAASIQDSTRCVVGGANGITCETGQQESSPTSLTASLDVAVTTTQPAHSVQLEIGPTEVVGGGVTITEPRFDQLVEQEEDGEGNSPATRTSAVTFSRVIEVRHRKSWNDIKLALRPSPAQPQSLLPLTVTQTCVLSLIFGIMWFFANYFYQLAFLVTSVGVVNTLSSLSGVFVLVLSALPVFSLAQSDKLTLTKLIVVSVSVGGAVLVGVSQISGSDTVGNFGLALCYSSLGAFLYACYLTLLKKRVKDTERLELPMFFGFVGVFNVVVMMPLLVVWHFSSLEVFELPPNSTVWTLLLINGFVGTVLSELLWLIGSFLTSPLIGTLSLALVAPLSITYDIVFEHTDFSALFFCGAVLLVVAFVGVAVLEAYGGWDPAWRGLRLLTQWLWMHWKKRRRRRNDVSETTQLLNAEREQLDQQHTDRDTGTHDF